MARPLPIVLLLFVLVACSGNDIRNAGSCDEVEQAWRDAGGFDADATVQLDTVDRLNDLAAEGNISDDDFARCGQIVFDAFRAMDCQDPNLSLSEEFCAP